MSTIHRAADTISRRRVLRGLGAATVALPAFDALFNDSGTAYAATTERKARKTPSRFVFWFNGNGIPEKHWIPQETGEDYRITPCLSPLARFRDDIHVISGLDNAAAALPQPGNSHYPSMSAVLTGKEFTGRGAGGPSLDQVAASRIGGETRFPSLQIGVSQESFGESIQRNMSWAGQDRPLPPEMFPHRLFDRLFGKREEGWLDRQRSVLDFVAEEARSLRSDLGSRDKTRLDEYLSSVRDLERSILSLPPEYAREVERPEEGADMRDWPRVAKLQSDLLVHALASGQTRVASYMLTKCQGLTRFPWLGHTAQRHHEYTHGDVETPRGMRILRDICRWHVEEFAYLVAKLKATPEGDGTVLDNTLLVMIHEHAEANPHKNNGHAAIIAGHAGGLKTGRHTRTTGTMGDLYLTLAAEALETGLETFPTATRKLTEII